MRARSRALDRLKSNGPSRTVLTEQTPTTSESAPSYDERRLRELLSKMPETQQQVLMLGYFEGLSTAEIAKRLEIPVGTVKSRTRAALGALRNVLGAHDD
jgi:RNA polymerase sigma-70 factor (ECF subfamily)